MFDVRIAQVGSQNTVVTLGGVGTVHLRRETALAFTTPGRIVRISVSEGDRVVRGQVLASLDLTTVNAQLGAAEAEQVRTGAELKRSTELFKKGWVTKARVENARAAHEAALAATRVRRFATATAQIVAPANGIILARPAEPDQTVDAGTPILVVGDESAGYILRIPVADRDAARLRPGAPAKIRVTALGNAEIAGFISQIGGRADPATGTFEVEVALPPITGLRPGQVGTAELVVADQSAGTALVLPAAALLAPRSGEAFVYVVSDSSNRVSLRKITISDVRDGGIAVTGGLAPGEWVVVSNLDRLADKDQVNPIRRVP